MELEPIIGLEIHVQLKTHSKMFCACANIFGDVPPNSAICPICLGYPGTLPVPNKTAIEWTLKTGAALNCELARESKFDRKSYFYPDLPKGYQISQYDKPFCTKGYLEVDGKKIGITRIHLEEDAAKNTHAKDGTLIDFNRAGTPLMEIVTEPDMRTPAEAKMFLQELQRIMRALGVSDADMEKGQLRCDANISLRPIGHTQLHPKTEVKNINSFKFVEKALQYEIARQGKMWEAGDIPNQATRGFNAATSKTTEQRQKEEAADYRYFPEPDIPPFMWSEEELRQVQASVPELPAQKQQRFVEEYGLTAEQAQLLISDNILADYFENTVSEIKQLDKEQVGVSAAEQPILVNLAIKLLQREIKAIANRESLNISPENFAELLTLIHAGRVPKPQVNKVLAQMQRTGGDPDAIIANLGITPAAGATDLEKIVQEVIKENPDVVAKVKAGKDAALQFLMGQVMAKTRGAGDPAQIIEMLKKNL